VTKETKIGLLVGLTFIILFAIILSKKGPNNTKATSTLTVAENSGTDAASRLTSHKPLESAGKMSVEPMLPGPISESDTSTAVTMLEQEVGHPIPAEGEPLQPLPENVINRLNLPMIETPVAIDSAPEDEGNEDVSDAVVAVLNGTSTATDSTESAPPTEGAPDTRSNVIQGGTTNPTTVAQNTPATGSTTIQGPFDPPSRSERPVAQPIGAVQPTKIIAVHEVRPGESLGKIAAKHYGRATPERIEAIFHANRDQLETVNSVRANSKLNIPMMDCEFAEAFEPADRLSPTPRDREQANRSRLASATPTHRDETVRIPVPVNERVMPSPVNSPDFSAINSRLGSPSISPNATPVRPSETSAPIKFTWYEVREKDTLSKISQSQLGSTKYYRDLYKMNSDILPNQHKLKPGMKIRIPAKETFSKTSALVPASLASDSFAELQ